MAEFIVKDANDTRLDRFIRRESFYLPQGIIEKYLRIGQIQVNGKKAKSSTRLQVGDVVMISDALRQNTEAKKSSVKITNFSPAVISLASKILKEYLIFSCDEFIAINKPCGLATQGGSKINISIDHALAYLNETTKTEYRLVHRLDKDTSGILIIAKNLASCIKLGDAFKTKELQKIYLAIVTGTPHPKEGEIENFIGKEKTGVYDTVVETKDGKLAKTLYETLSSDGKFSAIKFMPQTGRMHQLRFHSKQLDCPILGDVKYGGKPFERMMLHAMEFSIPASIFGVEYIIKAPWDKFFEEFLSGGD
jgi:23S rRNA pseudouridine955/2504/2580 synthase